MIGGGFEPDLTLLDALPHAAWVADPSGNVWYLNALGRAYTGWEAGEVAEAGWRGAVHPDDAPAMAAVWREALAGGGPYEAEVRIRRHDGVYRWHVERGTPYRDADGVVRCWIGTCTDVHEQHVADAELSRTRRQVDEQLAMLDAIQDHARNGLGVLDRDLRLVRANRALLESGEDPSDVVIGRHVWELVPDLREQLEPVLARVVEDRETVTDVEISAPDAAVPDRVRHWSLSYYPVLLDGELLGVGALSLEQTERVERVAALQASEELRALAERAGALGSWDHDLVTGASRWSSGLRAVLGLGPDDATTLEAFEQRVVPEDRPRYQADVRELMATGRSTTLRYRVQRHDEERIVEIRAAAETVDGEVVRIYGTTQDITERVEQSRRVEHIERLLTEAEAMAEVGSFETLLPDGTTLFSPGLRRLLGYHPDAPVAPTAWDTHIHPDDQAHQEARMADLVATGRMEDTQVRVVLPDGGERLLEVRGSCDRDPDGTPRRLVGTALDITERERLRRERIALLERSLTAADSERRRIAEHLHDDAVQALTATLLRVDHALATGSTELLGRARTTLEFAVRSLRLNIMELSPLDLIADGVEAAVAAYAEQLLELDGIAVRIDVALEDEDAVPAELLLAGYRITREALANVRRHANADRVTVTIAREDAALVGEVTDDGVGIDAEAARAPGHLGLDLMRQRAELLGGEVTIRRRQGATGTTVAWRLPL